MTGWAPFRELRRDYRRWLAGMAGCIVALLLASLCAAQSTAKPSAGEILFTQQCGTCHSVVKGDGERAGPSLNAVVGRTAGKLPGFSYSPALESSTIVWNAQTLDRWLTDSNTELPGSYMGYKQSDPGKRAQIIAYLASNPGN
jgi:cytochrome c